MQRLMPESYHNPVMLDESIDGLRIDPGGIYVDLTFGGGGHSSAILERLNNGHLYAFDQDEDALANTSGFDKTKFTFVQANFRYLKNYLKMYGVDAVDGILADLGVSSHQFDQPERGFSTRFNAQLDMRMDQKSALTAASVLNTTEEKDLIHLFSAYGEIRNARTLASAVINARSEKPLETIDDLKEIVAPLAPKGRINKYLAQVFQAIRIHVNDEMKALEEMLLQAVDILKPGGRLVVISYHSLEDRLVKNLVRSGNLQGKIEKDFYGNILRPLEPVTRKPMMADESEVEANNRARSAKLRIAEKTKTNG